MDEYVSIGLCHASSQSSFFFIALSFSFFTPCAFVIINDNFNCHWILLFTKYRPRAKKREEGWNVGKASANEIYAVATLCDDKVISYTEFT